MLMRSVWRAAALILAATLIVAACGNSDDSDDSSSGIAVDDAGESSGSAEFDEAADSVETAAETTIAPTTATTQAAEVAQDSDSQSGGDLGAGSGAQTSLTPADLGRDIVFTAFVTVETDDVAAAGKAAVDAIAPLGGLVFGQQTTVDPRPRTVLVIKVRPEDFGEALARIGEIGELRDQTVSAEDVTERVVDLESRIVTAEASVERLRGFLDNAATLDQVAAMERELQQRETDLELLRGQLRTIQQAVSLATITLTIEERVPEAPSSGLLIEVSAYVQHDDGRSCASGDFPDLTEGDEVTLCYLVSNTGDVALTDIEVADPNLPRRTRIEPVGDLTRRLEPGQSTTWYAQFEAGGASTLRSSARVSALVEPVQGDGVEAVSASDELDLPVEPDDSLPGVRDVVSTTISTTGTVIYVVFLGLIVATPGLIIAAIVFWLVRRRQRTTRAATPRPEPAQQLEAEG
ncbi:MAG: DUF4349 domain-containing protein [Acidimicrobiales bacterium]|nr:DUF4349 domain-containing protein [Acidimicrobiales bacterium]